MIRETSLRGLEQEYSIVRYKPRCIGWLRVAINTYKKPGTCKKIARISISRCDRAISGGGRENSGRNVPSPVADIKNASDILRLLTSKTERAVGSSDRFAYRLQGSLRRRRY